MFDAHGRAKRHVCAPCAARLWDTHGRLVWPVFQPLSGRDPGQGTLKQVLPAWGSAPLALFSVAEVCLVERTVSQARGWGNLLISRWTVTQLLGQVRCDTGLVSYDPRRTGSSVVWATEPGKVISLGLTASERAQP